MLYRIWIKACRNSQPCSLDFLWSVLIRWPLHGQFRAYKKQWPIKKTLVDNHSAEGHDQPGRGCEVGIPSLGLEHTASTGRKVPSDAKRARRNQKGTETKTETNRLHC